MGLFRKKDKDTELRRLYPYIQNTFNSGTFLPEYNLAVDNAVSLISNTLAIMPVRLMVHTKHGVAEAWSHNISRLLRDPAVEETPTLFWKTMNRHLLCKGNAYILKHKIGNEILSLELIDPIRVEVRRDSDGRKLFCITGDVVPFRTDRDVIHIPYMDEGYNGSLGRAPSDVHKDVITKNDMINEYISLYFKNGIGSRLLVELQDSYKPGDPKINQLMQAFSAYFNEFVLGKDNAGRPIVTPPGTKITKIEQSSNVQADVNTLYENSCAEVYRLYNIPPEILDSQRSKYNSLEQKEQDFYLRCIEPLAKHEAEALVKGLLPPEEQGQFFIEFDKAGLLEVDQSKKMDYYLKAYHGGTITLNEFRGHMNMGSVENEVEGNTRWIPSNLIPATEDNIKAILAKSKLALQEAKTEQQENKNLEGHNDAEMQDKLM